MTSPQPDRRRLKRIAHHLDPVVMVGERGVSEAVVAETQRALADHELIKVRIQSGNRGTREAMARALAQACDAEVLHRVGKVAVLFRKNAEPNHRLSNLTRFGE